MLKKAHMVRGIGVIQIVMSLLLFIFAIRAELGVSPVTSQLEQVLTSAEETLVAHRESYQLSVSSALKFAEPMKYWGENIKTLGKGLDKGLDIIQRFLPQNTQSLGKNMEKTGDVIIDGAQILENYGENDYVKTLNSFDKTAELLATCNETIRNHNASARRSYYLICTIASFVLLVNGIALCLLGDR